MLIFEIRYAVVSAVPCRIRRVLSTALITIIPSHSAEGAFIVIEHNVWSGEHLSS